MIELIRNGMVTEALARIGALQETSVRLLDQTLLLQQRIKFIEIQLATDTGVYWDAPFYWLENKGKRIGPYCQTCFDHHQNLIRLKDVQELWCCDACCNTYLSKGTKHH